MRKARTPSRPVAAKSVRADGEEAVRRAIEAAIDEYRRKILDIRDRYGLRSRRSLRAMN